MAPSPLPNIIRALARRHVHPTVLTVAALPMGLAAAVAFGFGVNPLGGFLMLCTGALDMLDGNLARGSGQVSRTGAFLDSTLDRVVDSGILVGLLVQFHGRPWLEGACLMALLSSLLVSYLRTLGEKLVGHTPGGFWQRPERLVLMAVGGLVDNMPLASMVLAGGTFITAVGRFSSVVRATRAFDAGTPLGGDAGTWQWLRRGQPAWYAFCVAIVLAVAFFRPDFG